MNGLWGPVLTAMATPFDDDDHVDTVGASKLSRHLLAHGTDGLVVCGTTGEGAVLDTDERLALWDACLDAVGDQAPVWASTGSYDTAATVRLSRSAAQHGVHGLLVVTPYYNKPPQEALYRHFATVAEATDLPIMLYNVPTRTSVNMTAETTLRLAHDVPSIQAIKEAHGDMGQAADILQGRPDGFRLLSGDDAATFAMVAMGGDGVVSVASHLVGTAIGEMIAALGAGDLRRAARLHLDTLPVVRALFAITSPILLKAALALLGLPAGRPRLPLIPADEAQVRALRSVMVRTGLLDATGAVAAPAS
jgi:4-hydroxy-tetrahydrodipicolinate synthase